MDMVYKVDGDDDGGYLLKNFMISTLFNSSVTIFYEIIGDLHQLRPTGSFVVCIFFC